MTQRALARTIFFFFLPCLQATVRLPVQKQELWQMDHTSWSGREGAPRDINVLAQTPDGILWIASERGLYTFDGFKFEAVRMASDLSGELQKSIARLLVAKDGAVWWATRTSGAINLASGRIRTFAKVQGRADLRNINSLQEDNHGTIWCLFNDKTLAFLGRDNLWHTIALPLGEGPHVQSFLVDQTGTRWVVQQNRLYQQTPKDSGFTATALHVNGPASIRQALDGGVWIAGVLASVGRNASGDTVLSHVDASGRLSQRFTVPGFLKEWLIGKDGEAWLVMNASGLRKLRLSLQTSDGLPEEKDTFRRKDGLTSDRQTCLFKDQEGNVWSGGTRGIDRFSPATLVRALRTQKTSFWSTCITPRNDLLVAGEASPLTRLHDGRQHQVRGVYDVSSLYCDGDTVWALDSQGIVKVTGDTSSHLPLLPKPSGFWDDYIFSAVCQVNAQTLYAWATGANEDALWSYQNGRWRRIAGEETFGRVVSMRADGEGHILFGRRDGKIDLLEGSRVAVLPVSNGDLHAVISFARTTEGIVALGRTGIALRISGQFRALRFTDPLVGTRVTGLVQSQKGDWWINSAAGIVRLPESEVDQAIHNPAHRLTGEQISSTAETAPLLYAPTGGSAYMDRDGRLWFASMDGVFSVDPDHLPVPSLPRVKILGVTGDSKAAAADGTFRPGLQTLRIQYIGVQLTEPASVIYRYRLEGHDAAWQDVGTRREAVYTDLKPGTYRFAVIASIAGKRWTDPIYSVPFAVRPRMYQTLWFQALCIVAALCMICLGFRFRVRRLSRLHQMQAEARAEERIRISRNLHNTLLQGLQGLILRFESVRKLVPPSAQVQDAFEDALLRAEQLVVESRTHVIELRTEAPDTRQLPSALQSVADMLWQEDAPAFAVVVHGEPRPLTSSVYMGVYQIAAAAITNAFLHSSATTLHIKLYYGTDSFKLHCHDDGVGMPETIAQHGRSGHWGIIGMRETAREIGAHFDLRSSPGNGTQVEVILRASVAYQE